MMYQMGVYCRLSKDDGENKVSESIENQMKLIREYVTKSEDLEIADIYIDDGYSGLYFANRPEFQRMMEDIYKGKIQGVITKDISRLGREHIETSNYIERVFPSLGVRYIAILDGVDSVHHSNEELAQFSHIQRGAVSLHNEDKIKVMKDGQSKKATYYNHIHTLFSLYSLSRKQQDIMCNMCFMPSSGISARIFSKWLELPTLNDVNDLIETGFVQSSLRHTISLHPMIQEIAVSETAPSVTSCHTLLDSLQKICLMHGIEVSYYKKLFQTVENIMLFIEKDDIPQYLLFLEDVFPYMEKYHYQKGMKKIIQELQHFIKANTYGTASDRALLLDYQATLEPKTEKAIKLEKEALAQIKETTKENAHLVSNLHSNLGGLYRINGQLDLAKRHMKMGISLLQQYQLLYTNDSIPQINNYAVLLIEIQEPDLALSALQKLAQIIKEYNSNHCLDYAQVQESLGSICLITANISQAKTHFKKALKIYEDIWADEPELIEEKYQAIQELYPQAGIALAKSILLTKH